MILGFAAVVLLAPSPAAADFGTPRQGFGLGIGMGTGASGLSGKFMMGPGAIQAVLGVWGGEAAVTAAGRADRSSTASR